MLVIGWLEKLTSVFALQQDFWLYMSETPVFSDFGNEDALVWHETNVPYAVWTPESVRHKSFVYKLSEVIVNVKTEVFLCS